MVNVTAGFKSTIITCYVKAVCLLVIAPVHQHFRPKRLCVFMPILWPFSQSARSVLSTFIACGILMTVNAQMPHPDVFSRQVLLTPPPSRTLPHGYKNPLFCFCFYVFVFFTVGLFHLRVWFWPSWVVPACCLSCVFDDFLDCVLAIYYFIVPLSVWFSSVGNLLNEPHECVWRIQFVVAIIRRRECFLTVLVNVTVVICIWNITRWQHASQLLFFTLGRFELA